MSEQDQIAAVRHYNRFYTRQIGLLQEGINASRYTLGEARVLYELGTRADVSAADLCRDLGLDPGYVSRLLKKLHGKGLLSRRPSPEDARRSIVTLTDTGRSTYRELDATSRADVGTMLARLSAAERLELVGLMKRQERLLGGAPAGDPMVLRQHRTGDIGWIAHRQALLYADEYGWDATYEALAAEILVGFVRNFDPRWENSWIAEHDGRIAGSVFLVRKSPTLAQLRLLYVEPWARGLGIGRRLVGECVRFARAKQYEQIVLWTQDILVSACRIYDSAGFRLTSQERHTSFGKSLNGQMWTLDLTSAQT
jgi:DNA-binding MarR family transcriptional regulator/N-acetylglutamate synthase-like GNAT family acetyltransferase